METPLAKERKMFGTTIAEMEAAKPKFYSTEMYAMAILSDVQEVMSHVSNASTSPMVKEELETCRQWVNKAKYFLAQDGKHPKPKRMFQGGA